MEIEKEYKGLITESEYQRLLDKYSPKAVQQCNYYYDTLDFDLHEKGSTLRLREKNDEWELTYKTDVSRENNVAVKQEYTQKLLRKPNLYKIIFLTNILHNCGADEFLKTVLTDVSVEKLRAIGCLVTERSKIDVGGQRFIELDKSIYLNFTDYEIEFEYTGESDLNALQDFLKENQITTLQSGGKYMRFIERYHNYWKIARLINYKT